DSNIRWQIEGGAGLCTNRPSRRKLQLMPSVFHAKLSYAVCG
ncbi:hypothetical protein LINPERHAP2_LOCUS33347, partial [Linum perenne]